jgi:hypothetical protein
MCGVELRGSSPFEPSGPVVGGVRRAVRVSRQRPRFRGERAEPRGARTLPPAQSLSRYVRRAVGGAVTRLDGCVPASQFITPQQLPEMTGPCVTSPGTSYHRCDWCWPRLRPCPRRARKPFLQAHLHGSLALKQASSGCCEPSPQGRGRQLLQDREGLQQRQSRSELLKVGCGGTSPAGGGAPQQAQMAPGSD